MAAWKFWLITFLTTTAFLLFIGRKELLKTTGHADADPRKALESQRQALEKADQEGFRAQAQIEARQLIEANQELARTEAELAAREEAQALAEADAVEKARTSLKRQQGPPTLTGVVITRSEAEKQAARQAQQEAI